MLTMLTFFFVLQEFPILCETCLGDNPYIRMVSNVRLLFNVHFVSVDGLSNQPNFTFCADKRTVR